MQSLIHFLLGTRMTCMKIKLVGVQIFIKNEEIEDAPRELL
jgi:hypothetical protein